LRPADLVREGREESSFIAFFILGEKIQETSQKSTTSTQGLPVEVGKSNLSQRKGLGTFE
jgi:hypothetical protein